MINKHIDLIVELPLTVYYYSKELPQLLTYKEKNESICYILAS